MTSDVTWLRSRRRPSDIEWRTAAYLSILAYGALCVLSTAWTGFHVGLNDFWGNVVLSRQVDWSSPSSLYNQFFPFGYAVVLLAFGDRPVIPAHLTNIVCGMMLLLTVWHFGSRLLGRPWAFCAVALVALHPQVFRYVTTPGPDIPAAALLAAGFDRLYWTSDASADRGQREFSAGAILGAAALLRYHALVFAAVTIAATAIGRLAPWRHMRLAGLGFFSVYVLQMIVAIVAHHTPFHTGQAYIFYKLVHGVNWFHASSEPAPSSAWAVIAASPADFASAYWRELRPLVLLPGTAAILALTARDAGCRRFGKVALLTLATYLAVVATGGSSRGSLPVRFLVALSITAMLHELATAWAPGRLVFTRRLSSLSVSAIALIAVVVFGVGWLRENYGTVKYRARANASYTRIEQILREDGVESATDVFASDFSLYFPRLPGYTPRTNGTWLRIDGARYDEEFPELCVESAKCFRADAGRLGVTHVVLTPDAAQLSEAFDRVYHEIDTAGFERRGNIAAFKIFRVR